MAARLGPGCRFRIRPGAVVDVGRLHRVAVISLGGIVSHCSSGWRRQRWTKPSSAYRRTYSLLVERTAGWSNKPLAPEAMRSIWKCETICSPDCQDSHFQRDQALAERIRDRRGSEDTLERTPRLAADIMDRNRASRRRQPPVGVWIGSLPARQACRFIWLRIRWGW